MHTSTATSPSLPAKRLSEALRRAAIIVSVMVLVGLLLLFWRAREDQTPPMLKVQPRIVGLSTATSAVQLLQKLEQDQWLMPVGQRLNVVLESNELAQYHVRYGGETHEAVTRRFELELQAAPGVQPLEVRVRDRAGNDRDYRYDIIGVPLLRPLVRTPTEAVTGEPFNISLAWPPESFGVTLAQIEITLRDQLLEVFATSEDAVALASFPLGIPSGVYPIYIKVQDSFGREATVERTVHVQSARPEVNQLQLTDDLLLKRTSENMLYEQEIVLDAMSASVESKPLWREPFQLPIDGRTSSGYGTLRRYGQGGALAYHTGTDIAAPQGTSITAVNKGVVVASGQYPIKGGFVMIDHGAGVFSLYYHQSLIYVSVGDVVQRGSIIGEVGSTGLATGPHLHWEMRVNDVPTDPLAWVDKLIP